MMMDRSIVPHKTRFGIGKWLFWLIMNAIGISLGSGILYAGLIIAALNTDSDWALELLTSGGLTALESVSSGSLTGAITGRCSMSVKQNKDFVRRAVAALNDEDWAELMGEFLATHTEVEAWVAEHGKFRAAFHDYNLTIDDMIAEGDKVVVRGRVRATHNGEFPVAELKGIAPTGKSLEWDEVWIMQVVDGKFGEGYFILDGVSRLQQLGVLPEPE